MVLLLGNWRAGLVVASVIPLSMLFALIMMRIFGVSANLMSLGAIDFGIVVDGAVIIVESVLHYLYTFRRGSKLSRQQMDEAITFLLLRSTVPQPSGCLLYWWCSFPIFTLEGIEGKMFLPMAPDGPVFAVLGSLLLSLTYVPVISAMALDPATSGNTTFADRLVGALRKAYKPAITFAVRKPVMVIISSLAALVLAIILFLRMGAEFVPTLEEEIWLCRCLWNLVHPESGIARSSEAERLLKQHFRKCCTWYPRSALQRYQQIPWPLKMLIS